MAMCGSGGVAGGSGRHAKKWQKYGKNVCFGGLFGVKMMRMCCFCIEMT
jgi:hypothetical protein